MTISKRDIQIQYAMAALGAITLCITSPAIKTYFFAHVSQQVLAFSNLIEIGLYSLIMSGAAKDSIIDKVKAWIMPIIIIDQILYGVVSLMGLEDASIRFISLAILNSTTTALAVVVIRDCINSHIKGRELTKYESKLAVASQVPSFIALALFMLVGIEMHVDTAIYIQWVSFMIIGVANIYFVKKYGKKKKEEE